jgi:MipA family protein
VAKTITLRVLIGSATALLIFAWSPLARAADAPPSAGDTKPALWIVTVGGYGTFEPKSDGSSSYHPAGRPIFNFRRSDAREWLSLPNDSFDFELVETDQFRAGPVATGHLTRARPVLDRGTKNFGNFDVSLEAGAFAEYWPVQWLRTRVEVRAAALGGSGTVGDVSADLVWKPTSALTVNAGPRMTVADGAYLDTYYGVNAQQAAKLGVAAYSAEDTKAGVKSVGIGTGFKYKFAPQWTGLGFVEYQRLSGAAAASPLVDKLGSPNQLSFGLGLSYDFRLDW